MNTTQATTTGERADIIRESLDGARTMG